MDNDERVKHLQAEVDEMKKAFAAMKEEREKAAKKAESHEEKKAMEKENYGEERDEELMSKKAKGRHAEDEKEKQEMAAVIASARKPIVDKILSASAKAGKTETDLAAQAAYLNTVSIADLNTISGMLPDSVQAPQIPASLSADLKASAKNDTELLKEAMYG